LHNPNLSLVHHCHNPVLHNNAKPLKTHAIHLPKPNEITMANSFVKQDIELDPTHNLPVTPVFWSTGSIVAAVLNCLLKQITPIMYISAYKGNLFGIIIETTPKAVIINHDDTYENNALFQKNAN
jgi:hypothetical protein